MLTAHERLRRSSVFQRAYVGRKSVSSSLFSLYVLLKTPSKRDKPQEEGDSARLVEPKRKIARFPLVGFVVSKKVHKRAVDRNRAKRRVREAYRLYRQGCEKNEAEGEVQPDSSQSLGQWYALVWVLNEKAVNAPWQEICKRMEDCLSEASRKYGRTGGNKMGTDPKKSRLPPSEPKGRNRLPE